MTLLRHVSAPYLHRLREGGHRARPSARPVALRAIGSTGSPLPAERLPVGVRGGEGRLWLASISGGTDVCTGFVGGCPLLPVRAGEICSAAASGRRVRGLRRRRRAGRSGQSGSWCVTAPMPSMPIRFWNDPDGRRYREAYFDTFPGVWRHGDWVTVTERGSW